jgi:hypothetical protein
MRGRDRLFTTEAQRHGENNELKTEITEVAEATERRYSQASSLLTRFDADDDGRKQPPAGGPLRDLRHVCLTKTMRSRARCSPSFFSPRLCVSAVNIPFREARYAD